MADRPDQRRCEGCWRVTWCWFSHCRYCDTLWSLCASCFDAGCPYSGFQLEPVIDQPLGSVNLPSESAIGG